MTPGQVIAGTAALLFVSGVIYGTVCDLRRWWDDRRYEDAVRKLTPYMDHSKKAPTTRPRRRGH